MTRREFRVELHAILANHERVATAIPDAHDAHRRAFTAHDDALVSAITANRAALRLLNRVIDEGIAGEP
jgi:hypothetical protein